MRRSRFVVGGLTGCGFLASLAAAQTEAPSPRVVEVAWPDGAPTSAAVGLPEFKDIEKTLLPVLVPKPFFNFRSFRFVGEELKYSASVLAKGASYSITGTRIAFDVPGETPSAPAAPAGEVTTEVDEQIASAGYVRYGVAYRVSVECDSEGDPRCTDDAYARALLRSVDLVGGGRGAAAPPGFPASGGAASTGPTLVSARALPPGFARPAGELMPNSGQGVATSTVYAPGIRFPIATSPAYLNSQVYGVGGMSGPPGSWRDARNYQYPWRDNFCERRSRATPRCPSGQGHQGQDIRGATPANLAYRAVAVEDGRISRIGSYSVVLAGRSGTEYRYLHLRNLAVRPGQNVRRGDPIGLVSNNFGNTATTVHLHFEMLQNVGGQGLRHVPPYTSLVEAYKAM